MKVNFVSFAYYISLFSKLPIHLCLYETGQVCLIRFRLSAICLQLHQLQSISMIAVSHVPHISRPIYIRLEFDLEITDIARINHEDCLFQFYSPSIAIYARPKRIPGTKGRGPRKCNSGFPTQILLKNALKQEALSAKSSFNLA